ncbi:calcium-binding protein [Chenggangzhangella methanolivorans]|uniref:calcium-binding protein n=1 Tax=Chenggangzhangella methanolivorans TaxID=1437009 RepID=UPI00361FE57C
MANVTGTAGSDFIHRADDGKTPPDGANDIPQTTDGRDSIDAGLGDDTIFGGRGGDAAFLNVLTDGADEINLGQGFDRVEVEGSGTGETQVRLTFTSAEVGNGDTNDSGTLPNQDGGLAVRLQAEDGSDGLTGPITRTDDEGITFVAGDGVKFDVRDLVSGAARGDEFDVVTLGTSKDDALRADDNQRNHYINGGAGDDGILGGVGRDFLVGGAGADVLNGRLGADSFIGGSGDDSIFGGRGDDVVFHNITTDGADQVNLGADDDTVNVTAAAETQVRLTFTSSEVGNGNANDSGTMPNQDGGLAVRMQAEDGSDGLTGPITRVDDEGVTFIAGEGVTFDVRDLVSGVARGDGFEVVRLGTSGDDFLNAVDKDRAYYINGGMGNDKIVGGDVDDFLVGGAGNDTLLGRLGDDSFIGGGGDDVIKGGRGADTVIHNITTDGADQIQLDRGGDEVVVNATTPTEVRLTFTSTEVGNGSGFDSGTMPNQDGGLAVRMQAEDGADGLTGPITRVDDEGITFTAGTGVTFDVRDLVSGVARGNEFEVVKLGTDGDNTMFFDDPSRATYINAGAGNDKVVGGNADDFLVGGVGDDTLNGGSGADSMIGGAGADVFAFSSPLGGGNVDAILDFAVADDTIELDAGVFRKIGEGGLDADAFTIGTAATDGDHRIIYDAATGSLFYDRDGSGDKFEAVEFAKITAGLDLSEDDFRIA